MHRQPQRQAAQERRPAATPARRRNRLAQAASAALVAVPMAVAGLVAGTAGTAAAVAPPAGPDPTLLVGSFVGAGSAAGVVQGFSTGTLAAVGPAGGVGVGGEPWTMAITPNGATAYVGNFDSGTVTPVNLGASTLSTGTDLCLPSDTCNPAVVTEPEAVAVTPDGTAAYVANSAASTVSEIFLTGSSAPKVATTPLALPPGSEPDAIAITPDGSTAWVADYGTSTVVPIELDNNDAVGSPIVLPAHSNPTGLAVTPDGKHLLVADSGNGEVTDITLATGAQASFPLEPAASGAAPEPWAVAITPHGTTAWVTDAANNVLVPVHIASDTAGTPVAVGQHPVAVAVAATAAGPTAYVADQFSNEVSVVDVGAATPKQTATIPTAPGPDTLAVTPAQAPVAAFTDTPGTSGGATAFDASASHTTPAGGALSYTWDFGDGSAPVTVAVPTTTHTYAAPGLYQVTLTVTDALGASTTVDYTGQTVSIDGGPSATVTQPVAIAAPLSNAAPEALVTGGTAGDAVPYTLDPAGTPAASQGTPVPTGASSDPTAVAIGPHGHTAYVVDTATGKLVPVDMRTGTTAPPANWIPAGTGADAVAVAPDGADAYVVDGGTSSVTDVTLASGGTSTIAVPSAGGSDLNAIAVDPAGTTAYVTDGTNDTITPIDLHTRLAGTPVGSAGAATFVGPDAIAVAPAGGTAYVVDAGTPGTAGGVTVVDISGATPVPKSTVTLGGPGGHPDAIAVAPDGAHAYVVDSPLGGPATITPLALAAGSAVAGAPVAAGSVTAGGQSYTVMALTGVAVTPDGSTAYAVGTATDAGGASVDVVVPFALSGRAPVAGTPVVMPAGTGPTAIAITADRAPIAALQAPAAPVAAGSTVDFGALASSNPSSPIATYAWDFGDGTPVVTTGTPGVAATAADAQTTHAYAVAGTYTASVTLTDTAGTSTTAVYTGQSMVRDGGPQATQQQTVVVYPTVTKVVDAVSGSGVGAAGDKVTVVGTGFSTAAGATTVDFGAHTASAVSCPTTTSCTAVVPAGTGTVDVTVTVGGQTSPVAPPGDRFTYLPTVTSVSPTHGPTGGGTAVAIDGTGFSTSAGATAFDFGPGNPATKVACASTTQCTALTPAGTGTVDVRTTVTAGGTALTSRPNPPHDQFTYGTGGGGGGGGGGPVFPPSTVPVVTGVTPATGPAGGGTAVTVSGDNLSVAGRSTTIDFGTGNPGTAVDCVTPSSCTVVSPAGTGTVDVTVTTADGTSAVTLADRFVYTATAAGGSSGGALPVVTSVSPGYGAPGTDVVVTGTGFSGVTAVDFGTSGASSFTVASPTRIDATVPAGVTGTVDVTVTTGAGTSATSPGDRFTVVPLRAAGGSAGYRMVAADGGVFDFGAAQYLGSLPGDHVAVSDIVASASTPGGGGYWAAGADGGVFAFGDAGYFGSEGGKHLNAPIVGMAATPDGGGYWLVAADGGIFSFGNAGYFGSEGGKHLNAPIVGMAATPDGGGYWLVAADGGIFSFGDAGYFGSEGGKHLNQPVVGIAATADGGGYWLVARDGGIFAFGDATFMGSTGDLILARPIVTIATVAG